MSGLHELVDAWSHAKKPEDAYASVEAMAQGSLGELWPYAVLHDQIESGWSNDDYIGAIALHLTQSYKASAHGPAALLTLATHWPEKNATAALNLLALAHRCIPLPQSSLGRFIGQAAVDCLQLGLQDPRPLVSEEAANVLGGLSTQHVNAVTGATLARLNRLAESVLSKIDDVDVAGLLRRRIKSALTDPAVALAPRDLTDSEARLALKELDPLWSGLGPATRDIDLVATIRTHATGVIWRCTGGNRSPIEVVYVYSPTIKNGHRQGWTIIEPWFDTVRTLLIEGQKRPKVAFEPLDAMSGSLLVTLRVEAEETDERAILDKLKETQTSPTAALDAFGDVYDLLRGQGLRIRVAHIQADGRSASISVAPETDTPANAPYRSKRLTTHEIPQANDLEKIFLLIAWVAKGTTVTPAAIEVGSERQVQYYRAAARILALLSIPEERLTRTGWLLNVAVGDDKYRRLRASFEASACGQAWLEWAGAAKLSDIASDSGAQFLAERSELTGDTIGRRANTINVWLATLRRY